MSGEVEWNSWAHRVMGRKGLVVGGLVYSPNRIVWGSLLRKKVGRSGWMGGPR